MSMSNTLSSAAVWTNISSTSPSAQGWAWTPSPEQEEPSLQAIPLYQLSEALWRVVPPFIMMLGTFGNVMTMVIMWALRSGNQAGDQAMPVYFTSLAVCDLGVLWVGLTRHWTRAVFGFDIRNVHVAVCRLHKFLVFSVGRMATWLLVAVTTERVLIVLWPLRHGLRATRTRAVMVVLAIVAACCLLDTAILVTYGHITTSSGKTKCKPLKAENWLTAFYENTVYPWLNIILGSLLPLLILIFNNVILGWKVRRSVAASRVMSGAQQAEAREKTASSLSITLVVTSGAFFLLTSSVPVGFLFKRYYLPSLVADVYLEAHLDMADAVLDLLWYSNSAVNFYLYCLTGAKFRNEAISSLTCGRLALQTGKSAVTTATISGLREK